MTYGGALAHTIFRDNSIVMVVIFRGKWLLFFFFFAYRLMRSSCGLP